MDSVAKFLRCQTCRAECLPAPSVDGVDEIACSTCGTTYRRFHGTLLAPTSSRIVIERASTRRAGQYFYLNQFGVALGDTFKMFSYKRPTPVGAIHFPKGVRVTAVCIPRAADEDLAYLYCHDLNQHLMIRSEDGQEPYEPLRSITAEPATNGLQLNAMPGPSLNARRAPSSDTLPCSRCGLPILDPQDDGEAQASCQRCAIPYLVFTGELSNPTSSRIVLQRQSTRQSGRYSYFHQFSVFYGAEYKSFSYSTPTPIGGINFSKGSRASVVCTRRGSQIEDLLYVHSHVSHTTTKISKPGGRAASRATLFAVLSFVLVVAVGIAAAGLSVALFVIGGAIGLLVKIALNYYLQPKVRLDPSGMRAVEHRQELLKRKEELASRRQALTRDGAAIGARIDRLVASEAKMLSVGEQMYRAKLERTRAAVRALLPLFANQKQLISMYERAITMVEIELDDAGLERVAGEATSDALSTQLAELHEVEATNADLRIRAEAEDEVQALLTD